ncbi:MAG: Ig-like domain-containing protein [Candidatus Omnitrophica bacterium]|nr:Ig-like domain-containing protein [Candidatus Omnitrophota bacterium]
MRVRSILWFYLAFVLFSASVFGTQSVTLAWDENTELDLAGYNLYYGTSSGNYTFSSSVGNVTQTTVAGLEEGLTYYFVVTAYNTSGLESDPSNEVMYQVPNAVVGPVDPVIAWSNPADIVYGTRLDSVQLNATADVPGILTYDPPAGTMLQAGNAQALSAVFTPTDTNNYNTCIKTVSVNVLKAPLTITAEDKSMSQGSPIPPLTARYSFFAGDDSVSCLDTPVVLATTATSSSQAGVYPIAAVGATSANYDITFVNGLLTVTAPQLVSISLSPSVESVSEGQTVTFTAIGTYTDGTTQDISSEVTWGTSSPTVAAIDSSGVVVAEEPGTALITASMSNLSKSAILTVESTLSFSNENPIEIPDLGSASPYPSTIQVSGCSGTVNKVTVTLRRISHNSPSELQILLVNPGGKGVILAANAGGSSAIKNATLTFDDAAGASLPRFDKTSSGSYLPTRYGTVAAFPAPAPGSPYGSALSAFNGTVPNGNWSLYIMDKEARHSGTVRDGWSLAIATSTVAPMSLATFRIEALSLLADGRARLAVKGPPGKRYDLQVSTDFNHWRSVRTDVVLIERFTVVDENAGYSSARFYRIMEAAEASGKTATTSLK